MSLRRVLLAFAAFAAAAPALAQETTADARAEGKAMAEAFRQDGTLIPDSDGQALEGVTARK